MNDQCADLVFQGLHLPATLHLHLSRAVTRFWSHVPQQKTITVND
jgi:hypothetical protein